ncbi:hypothetical protein C8J57DRAFT_428431 [Mycena rebaudengoi]|nr:hypothetical protein C8J57DRAFT_428431 [Mycena rebaudengoi]
MTTLSANSSGIQYSSGNWTQIDAGSIAYFTRDANATVTFNFNGTLITVVGAVDFAQRAQNSTFPLAYVLDGKDAPTFLLANTSASAIYSSPPLLPGAHTLSITLTSDDATLSVSGAEIANPPTESPDHHRTIAIVAGSIGGFILFVVVVLALFLFNRRQRRYPSPQYALGPLQVSLPATKEAFTSPKYHNHGLSFTQSTESVNVLPRVKAPPPPVPPVPRQKSRRRP